MKRFILEYKPDYAGSSDMPYTALQHNNNASFTETRDGDLYLCPERCFVSVEDQEIKLTVKEFDILSLLAMNPRRVFTYEIIIDLVWQENYTCYSRNAIHNHSCNLQKKLKASPDISERIKAVAGVGYKYEPV